MATLHLPHFRSGTPAEHARLRALSALVWSAAGGLVLLFLFFTALGAFDPIDAVGVTIAFAALGVLWLVHAWPRLRRESGGSKAARERRGF